MLHPDGLRELIPLAIPASMLLSGVPIVHALIWWNIIVISASLLFGFIGLNAAHHHPNIHHDGDEPRYYVNQILFPFPTLPSFFKMSLLIN